MTSQSTAAQTGGAAGASAAQPSAAAAAPLAEIFEEFRAVPDQQRLKLLLDYANRLPELPEAYRENFHQMDEVLECQTPLFLATEFRDEDRTAEFFFAAPEEVPTTRGFASIIQHGLSGQSYDAILGAPMDIGEQLGMGRVIAPLRLRAVSAMFGRVRRSVEGHIS
ncbi:SufE family protein [Nesterenkonia cremea]|uniref:Hypothetical SufE-like protein n=1 Tax=Nesterenkonia cremea TaxID=1882340 RepID=A0A917ATI2_9MICC|nr:SufE family protein [Nesterenkonia cremea]GGE73380.1 hypothetical SufE-like protein [Nesterenkonia cremea]